jgi:signal transduction histidine kinase
MVTQLREAEEIRQNLLADVSHELRTPLTVLEGQLRGALDNVMELDGENLANLYNQTRHLIKLVNELYELAQAEARMLSMEFVSTEISPLVKEVYDIFRPLAEEQEVSLNLDIAKGLPEISIDTYRIRQSLHNLLANSLRYTPPGGSINLRVAKEEENVVIEIMDTGKGIEPEHLNKIFDRLYRIDKSRNKDPGGTGLGLAIVKAIIEAHNGLVTAQSEGLGEGSTFTITFPIA